MRFDRISIRNIGPFRAAELQLAALTGTLIAITGANGTGKSTLLELLAAALYRTCPTRGSLSGLATARDAHLEVEAVNGQRWTLSHTLDAVSGKSSAVVFDAAGAPAYDTDKVRDFDRWSASHLPPPEVLYASSFSAQGSGGFLELKAGERKSVLLRVLGIDHLEVLSERARERARDAKSRHQVAAAREADERGRGMSVESAGAALNAARSGVAVAMPIVDAAAERLREVESIANDANERHRALLRAQRSRDDVAARLAAAEKRQSDLQVRFENNHKILADAEVIRAAAARAEVLRARLAEQGTEAADLARADAAVQAARQAIGQVKLELSAAQREVSTLEAARPTAAEVDLAEQHERTSASAIAQDEAVLVDLESIATALETSIASGARVRIGCLRGALGDIAGGEEPADHIARGALEVDDETAAQLAAAPEKLQDTRRDIAACRTSISTQQKRRAEHARLAARRPELEERARRLCEIRLRVIQIGEHMPDLEEKVADAERLANELRLHATAAASRRRVEEAELAAFAPRLALVPKLDAAEGRLAELEPQLADAEAERARARAALSAADFELTALAGAAAVDLEAPARALRDAEAALRSAEAVVAVREAALADARASEARLMALAAEREAIAMELADWERLAQDLGRDGLQALEVDAAGPELTALVNDLLHTCVGTRWTVSIEATRTSSDGKRQLEGCEVRVIDTERGRDAAAESLSGGEKVIVSEAISLALAMLACRRSGMTGVTLIRDESGAALDASNARAYVAMLRRAAELVGAHQVLLVSHALEVQELCDARVIVADGQIRVAP